MHHREQYVISHSQRQGHAPSCFPVDYATSNLMDISCIGDTWAKFFNTQTGETIDCAVFAARLLKLEE